MLTGFSQQEVSERLFAFIKCSVIFTVMENSERREAAYQIDDNGILLMGIIGLIFDCTE